MILAPECNLLIFLCVWASLICILYLPPTKNRWVAYKNPIFLRPLFTTHSHFFCSPHLFTTHPQIFLVAYKISTENYRRLHYASARFKICNLLLNLFLCCNQRCPDISVTYGFGITKNLVKLNSASMRFGITKEVGNCELGNN